MDSAPKLLYLASNNRHKLEELKQLCGAFFPHTGIRLASDLDPTIDWDETGDTFEDNARIKAEAVWRVAQAHGLRAAVLGDDSGLQVDALGGAPGVHSARYCGRHGDDAANNAKLLAALANTPDAQRTARFVCALHIIDERGASQSLRGECEGMILRQARGSQGFGYDPLFQVAHTGCALAELPAAVKNQVSHRRRALDLWLKALGAKLGT